MLRPVSPTPASAPVAPQATAKPKTTASAPTGSDHADQKLGNYQRPLEGLWNPAAVAIDSNENIYIAESGRHQIVVYNANGKRQRTIGRNGSGEGELYYPAGIALASDGDLYISDSGNHRIAVFDQSGKFKRSWGGYGSAPGQLIHPTGLAVAVEGVYVADNGNDRVQLFDHQGNAVRTIGKWGSGPGNFQRPVGVAVDSKDQLYVLDRDNNRIQVFDHEGEYLRTWGQWGPFPEMVAGPEGFCLHNNLLYIADTMNHRVEVMSPDGRMAYQWGIHAFMPREGDGKLHYPNAIAIAPSGRFAIVCEGFENRCQIFGLMPSGETPPTSPFIQNDPSGQSHFGASAGLSGKLMALGEEEIDQVSIHNLLDGAAVRIGMVGQHGIRTGQFVRPAGLDLDAKTSTLIVGDAGNRRLHEFRIKQDPPGQLRFIPDMAQLNRTLDFAALKSATPDLRDRPVIEPTFVRRGAKGVIIILDAVQCVVVVLDQELKVQQVWPSIAKSPLWINPTDLAIDPAGKTVYIPDAGTAIVHAYSIDGRPRAEWKSPKLSSPGGVAVNADGILFASDEFAARILKFDAKGKLLQSWGTQGLGAGQLYRPRGLMLTDEGNLIVIDHGNHRCQLFAPDGRYINVFGATYFIRPAQRGVTHEKNQN